MLQRAHKINYNKIIMYTQNNLIIIMIVRSTKPKYICIYIYTPLALPL